MTTAAAAGEAVAGRAGARATLGARIRATFVAPSRLADLIAGTPVWLDVLVLSTVVAIAAAAMLPSETFLEASREAVSRRGAPVEITSSPQEVVRWGRYLGMLSAAVGHPLVAFGLAGLLAFAFTIVPRGRASFAEHLSLASHALLIPALGSVIGLALRHLRPGEEAHPSLALLAPFVDPASTTRAFLELISPFTLWMLVVLALGVARLEPRRSKGVAISVLVGSYLILAMVLAG